MGVDLISGLLPLPLHLIVPDEVEGEFGEELLFLKEFAGAKERKGYLREMLRNLSAGDERYNSYLAYAFSLYRDEIEGLVCEEGVNMTMLERNMMSWIEDYNLKERFVNEGLEKGLMQTARRMKERGLELNLISDVTGLSEEVVSRLQINV